MISSFDVIVVGGGLAGLSCAKQLVSNGLSCRLLEAGDQIGGRVQTDALEGFLLDRGFQVFLTAYPEAQAVLDYEALRLCSFTPGALVRYGGKFQRLADPWRQPQHALATAISPVATLLDKLRIARFRSDMGRCELESIYQRPEKTTLESLRARGFSDMVLERFMRPFFGGIFLEPTLQTSSRMGEFVFRMFAQGGATLPEEGMGEIPKQLASDLPTGVIRTASTVSGVSSSPGGQKVRLESGKELLSRAVVIATEEPVARKLLEDPAALPTARGAVGVDNLYFAAEKPPLAEPTLVLNGEGAGAGPINNLAVPSLVSPRYAPPGKSLISVSVLDGEADKSALLEQVRRQLGDWFGEAAQKWRHLRTYSIPYALPSQLPSELDPVSKPSRLAAGLYVAGDHCDTASINGALAAGRRAAEAVLDDSF